jgi:HTH-type transcriptional regulator / antitoxin HigA
MDKQWYLLESKDDYDRATARFEEIYRAEKDSVDFKEMQLLALLINEYEKREYDISHRHTRGCFDQRV